MRSRCPGLDSLLVIGLLLTAPALGIAAGPEPAATEAQRPDLADFGLGVRTPAQTGSLHRVAATLESVLDIYRLALVELVPSMRLVREAGETVGATPSTTIPDAAAEVYVRLARSLRNRIPESEMPPVARGYHAEAIDGLEALATAERIDQVVRPAQIFVYAIREIASLSRKVIDLYSRQRPIQARVIDQDALYMQLEDALDEFAAAEAEIKRRRRRRRSQDEIAGAFRRTEIALGHLLDLWAAARSAGIDLTENESQPTIDIQMQPQISTDTLALIVDRVESRADELEAVVASMQTVPPAIDGPMVTSQLIEIGDGRAEVRLAWTAWDDGHADVGPRRRGVPARAVTVSYPFAQLRVYRLDDRDGIAARMAGLLRCEGKSETAVQMQVGRVLEGLDSEPVLVAQLAPGRTSYADPLPKLPVVPPIYRIIPVTAFGVEGVGPEAHADFLPGELAGVLSVRAEPARMDPTDPDFYLMADAVTVTWEASVSDATRSPRLRDLAAERGLPTVASYAVERSFPNGGGVITRVTAGTHRFIDHPRREQLAAGVRYRVYAVSELDQLGRSPVACEQSSVVRVDVDHRLELARAGAGAIERPTDYERRMRLRFEDEAQLKEAKLSFERRDSAARQALLERWWQSMPQARRIDWLERLPALFRKNGFEAWLVGWDGRLSARDEPWARAEIFMAEQSPLLRDEVTRWWTLLDEEGKQLSLRDWRDHLNRDHLAWLLERMNGDVNTRYDVEAPARLLSWWTSRGAVEQLRLEAWWQEQPLSERIAAVAAWYKRLVPPARLAVRWPDWDQRSEAERRQLLASPPSPMPTGMWKDFLAWLAWEDLEGDRLLKAVAAEVSAPVRLLAAAVYSLRPADRAVGFRLALLIMLSLLGGGATYCVIRGLLTPTAS